jgi:Ni2+-binding GTPase involved in maturation of urease and hydrogenase
MSARFTTFAYNYSAMKKTILTFFIIISGVVGLDAQSRKTDSTLTTNARAVSTTYTLTHHDSLMINQAIKDAQLRLEDNLFIDESGFPYPDSRRVGMGMNDVIDVGHDIR